MVPNPSPVLRPLTPTSQLWMGLTMPLRGALGALRDARLLALAATFGIVAVALLAVLIFGDVLVATWLVDRWLGVQGFWAVLAWLALFIAGLPLVFVLFRTLGKPLTWDFRRRLAARAEQFFAPRGPTYEVPGSWFAEAATAVRAVPASVLLSLGVLLLNVVPVLGQALSFAAAIWLTARGGARELLEPPMARRGFGGDAISHELQRHRHLWLSAAASTAALSLVPLVNFLALPGAIVGASDTWARLEAEGLVPAPPDAR